LKVGVASCLVHSAKQSAALKKALACCSKF
jgi:hypothetical protein